MRPGPPKKLVANLTFRKNGGGATHIFLCSPDPASILSRSLQRVLLKNGDPRRGAEATGKSDPGRGGDLSGVSTE